MNKQWQNRGWILILSMLSLGIILAGCGQTTRPPAEIEPTVKATTSLGSIHVGELQEITPPLDELQGWHLGNIVLNGHILIGQNSQISNGLVAVDLRTQKVAGGEDPLSLSAWFTGPDNHAERYYVWGQSKYIDDKYIGPEIYVADLYSNTISLIDSGRWADVSGSMVVYSRDGGHPNAWDLYTKNLETGEVSSIVARKWFQEWPKIKGEWIVYVDVEPVSDSYERERVRAYNISTGEDLLLGVTQFATQSEGGTYGIGNGKIVWIGWQGEHDTDTYGLNVFDMYSHEVYTLSNLSADDMSPTFDMVGDLLFFGCEMGYCGYDLVHNELFEIPYNHPSTGFIYLSEDYVVFKVKESKPNMIDIMQTPGAAIPTTLPLDAPPTPVLYKLFVVPITRE